MIFVLTFITLLTVGSLFSADQYQPIYIFMILVVSAGWCITKLLDNKSQKRFRVNAVRKDDVTRFEIYDHNDKVKFVLVVMENTEGYSLLERDYHSLNSLTWCTPNQERDSLNLVKLLSSLDESERNTVTEQFFNLLLVLTHQKPVISHTCYEDYSISESAKEQFASSLRLAL